MQKNAFTLLEIVIALAVIVVGVVSLLHLFPIGLRASRSAGDFTTAALIGQRKMSEIKRTGAPGFVSDSEIFDYGEGVSYDATSARGIFNVTGDGVTPDPTFQGKRGWIEATIINAALNLYQITVTVPIRYTAKEIKDANGSGSEITFDSDPGPVTGDAILVTSGTDRGRMYIIDAYDKGASPKPKATCSGDDLSGINTGDSIDIVDHYEHFVTYLGPR